MTRWILLLGMIAPLLAGCGSEPADRGWVPPRPLGSDLSAYKAPLLPTTQPAAVTEPTGPLSLRQALALALMNNPELAGSSWEVRSAEARRLQANLPPNPELEVNVENFGGTGAVRGTGAAETTLQLGQLIELGDKRMKRNRVAALDRDLAGWDYEARRLDVYAQTTRSFVTLLAAQEKTALAGELMRISQQVKDTATERVNSGKAAPLEQNKAEVALGLSKLELEQAKQEVESQRQQLASLWGAAEAQFTIAEGHFQTVAAIPTRQQLSALLEKNPDIARWRTEMEQRQAALALARAKGIPDITIRGGGKYLAESADAAFVAGISVPLPLFDRNQGNIRESRFNLAKAHADRQAAEARAHASLADAYQLLAVSFTEIQILTGDVLPAAEKAFDAANEGYRHGKFAYLDVLDAQRTLFELKVQSIEARAAYHRAAADVERLVGQDLQSIQAQKQEK
jgi:outer membrane protein, heavy metal efflux system